MPDNNTLSRSMQKRLDQWRKNVLEVSNAKVLGKAPGNFVARRGDYGDDIEDVEAKKDQAWRRELDYQDYWRKT